MYAFICISMIVRVVWVRNGAQTTSTFTNNDGKVYLKNIHLSRVSQVSKENIPLQDLDLNTIWGHNDHWWNDEISSIPQHWPWGYKECSYSVLLQKKKKTKQNPLIYYRRIYMSTGLSRCKCITLISRLDWSLENSIGFQEPGNRTQVFHVILNCFIICKSMFH